MRHVGIHSRHLGCLQGTAQNARMREQEREYASPFYKIRKALCAVGIFALNDTHDSIQIHCTFVIQRIIFVHLNAKYNSLNHECAIVSI